MMVKFKEQLRVSEVCDSGHWKSVYQSDL